VKLPSRLLVITDRAQARLPLPELAESVFAAQGRWLLLREKDLEPSARLALARDLKRSAERWGAVLSLSSDLETAAALGISLASVKREWSVVKGWLYRELVTQPAPGAPDAAGPAY